LPARCISSTWALSPRPASTTAAADLLRTGMPAAAASSRLDGSGTILLLPAMGRRLGKERAIGCIWSSGLDRASVPESPAAGTGAEW